MYPDFELPMLPGMLLIRIEHKLCEKSDYAFHAGPRL